MYNNNMLCQSVYIYSNKSLSPCTKKRTRSEYIQVYSIVCFHILYILHTIRISVIRLFVLTLKANNICLWTNTIKYTQQITHTLFSSKDLSCHIYSMDDALDAATAHLVLSGVVSAGSLIPGEQIRVVANGFLAKQRTRSNQSAFTYILDDQVTRVRATKTYK